MTWGRAHADMACGSCGATIEAEAPVLLVTSAKLPRCEECAKGQFGAAPPADLPQREVPTQPEAQPFAAARELARDYKRKQAGDADTPSVDEYPPSVTDRVREIAARKGL